MAEDIAPKLYEQLHWEFEQNMQRSIRIQSFLKKGERASQKEVSLYSAELGKCASDALSNVLSENNLPNGKLYWNIAQRTIVPLLEEIHEMVMDAAEAVQKREDKEIGINLKPIRPEFPKERIEGLINKLIEYQEDEDGKPEQSG